ncbi:MULTISPECIES: NADH:ubiquinone oxidoreductase subunit NDUFA12 [unclassified Acidisoma]|jgi:NADH:ubiquinone oxidoreductase subunit|uniref:NADH:ubiquinone oxidoreductase subunit NDUFA12 n=1 Tax=unclassified Acidisoma TaxID=2634065 RepID=UPI003529DEEB
MVADSQVTHIILWCDERRGNPAPVTNRLLDQRPGIAYMGEMTLATIGYLGTRLFTSLRGRAVGQDSFGNRYFQERGLSRGRRQRRWVLYRGAPEASTVPPEWHSWLHYTTDAPLTDVPRHPWQKPHLPNRTGTPFSYRPPGHDYSGGTRSRATGDYEAWSPEAGSTDAGTPGV